MKGPYPKGKGKGKVHPSPGPSASSVSGDVTSALKLLPADIHTQTAALGEKDKEVLAYLITRSMKCHVAPRAAASHRPMIGCGCFECYKSFWSRWNSSTDKGIIDQAVDAFEEHLARVEKEKNDKTDKNGKKKNKKGEVEEKIPEESGELEEKVLDVVKKGEVEDKEVLEEAVVSSESTEPEMLEEEEAQKVLGEEGGEDTADGAVSGGGERRKSWVDLMGIFNFRFFGA